MNKRATYEEVQPQIAAPAGKRILVWDLPTRIFHWSLVLAVTVAIVSGEIGGDWMEIHGKAGLAILGLVTFRLVWGFAGSTHARFVNFAPTAGKLRAYLRGRWKGQGHNPLGALSVFALLGLLAVQATTGLFGNDEISFTGPLFALVEEGLANRLTGLHKQLAYVLLGVLALHIVAILVYLVLKKDNLVKPMVTGFKEVRVGASATKGSGAALVLALAAAAAVVTAASGAVHW
ncbi:cytochrome b/b6 domain-containing protein [Duganella sp. Dugasp56]|uniref:cytochrome b/b6 domain-containing protein n=1 Tax=Duganella sp. Dugasp56 TaxID=3243046 RepID=UPI0039AFF017